MTTTKEYKLNDRIIRNSDGALGTVVHVYGGGAVNMKLDADNSVHYLYQNEISEAPAQPVSAAAPVPTKEAFYKSCTKALVKLGKARKFITADDLIKTIDGDLITGRAAGLSAFMSEAAKMGIIKATKRYRRSVRTKGPLKVWQSLVYGSAAA